MIRLTRLPPSEKNWFHQTINDYFQELVPNSAPLDSNFVEALWQNPSLTLLAIQSTPGRVGFAIIQKHPDSHELSEFCILPDHRGAGLGARAATLCLERHPGAWTLVVASALPGTARFWDRLLPTLPGVSHLGRGPPLTPHQSHSYAFTYKGTP